MELTQIIKDIKKVAQALALPPNSIEFFLFGSILKNPNNANDVDLLIIYKNQEQLEIVKARIRLLNFYYPLHITCFTFTEEAEFNFISDQKAQKIL